MYPQRGDRGTGPRFQIVIDRGLPRIMASGHQRGMLGLSKATSFRAPAVLLWADLEHPIWDVTRAEAKRDDRDPLIALPPEDCPPFGIITTQSCDLDEASPKRPWFHVAPVVEADVFADADLASIRAQKYGYLFALPQSPVNHGCG